MRRQSKRFIETQRIWNAGNEVTQPRDTTAAKSASELPLYQLHHSEDYPRHHGDEGASFSYRAPWNPQQTWILC